MGKELDPRVAEYAYIDRIVLFHQLGTNNVTTETVNPETGEPVYDSQNVTTTNINMIIRYEIKDQNKNTLKYEEVTHNLFNGEGTKSVQDIATLIYDNLNTLAIQDKYNITGFQPTP